MFKKITDLIDVKSIITIMVFGVFSYLSIVNRIDAKDFMIVLTMLATYYFTKKGSNTKE